MKIQLITKLITACGLLLAHSALAFESNFISIQTQGSGPDIILVHGFASSSEVWSDLVQEISPDYKIHLVQITGFAGSRASEHKPVSFLTEVRSEIVRYINEESLERPTVIGHSMGGLLSLLIASDEVPELERVIVVDALPFYSLIFNPFATADMVMPQAQAMEQQLLSADDEQFAKQAASSAAILTKDPEKRKLLLKWSQNSDRSYYAQYFRELLSYDARPELKNITCPVTVFYAYDEAMGAPKEQLNQLYTAAYANLDGVNIQEISGSYHFIMWDQPKRFILVIQKELGGK